MIFFLEISSTVDDQNMESLTLECQCLNVNYQAQIMLTYFRLDINPRDVTR